MYVFAYVCMYVCMYDALGRTSPSRSCTSYFPCTERERVCEWVRERESVWVCVRERERGAWTHDMHAHIQRIVPFLIHVAGTADIAMHTISVPTYTCMHTCIRDIVPSLIRQVPQEQQIPPCILLATSHLPFPWICLKLKPIQACDEALVVDVLEGLCSRSSVKLCMCVLYKCIYTHNHIYVLKLESA